MSGQNTISDTSLLNRLVNGDKAAYEILFMRYYATLCAYARLYVKKEEIAENIVQDLMLWLWENRTTLRVNGTPSKYLFSAVRNNCLSHINHESIERRVLNQIRTHLSDEFETPDFYAVEELQEQIKMAVAELPESYRRAFELNRFQRKTYDEIASELSVSAKTVDYRIQQSLKILRIKLKDFLPLALLMMPYDSFK